MRLSCTARMIDMHFWVTQVNWRASYQPLSPPSRKVITTRSVYIDTSRPTPAYCVLYCVGQWISARARDWDAARSYALERRNT